MKGISTVIATILMLMITIGLAGTAYVYIQNTVQQQFQGIEVIDSFCSSNNVTIVIRNSGTAPITSVTCQQTSPSGDAGSPCTSTASTISLTIEPGSTNSFQDVCSGSGARSCIYRITPPSGRSASVPAQCI